MSEKPLVLPQHASDALIERVLRIEWIEQAVRRPDWIAPDPNFQDRERRFKVTPDYGNRVLRVVVVETSDEIRIVTAFFDRKARRP